MSACAAWLPSEMREKCSIRSRSSASGRRSLLVHGRIAEDAVERLRVRLLDAAHRRLQGLADIGRDHAHIAPVAALRNLKAVVLRELGVFLIAAGFRQRRRVFLVMHIRDAFEEQQREDVGLEVGGIHRPAQDVGRLPEVGFELVEGEWCRCSCLAHSLHISSREMGSSIHRCPSTPPLWICPLPGQSATHAIGLITFCNQM